LTTRPGGTTRHLRTLLELGSPSRLTDGQLLERFATRGDGSGELAFGVLVDRHGPMVLRACRSVVRDDHEAMDAFQATFLVLARKGRSLWVRDSIAPWLHRVARRVAGKARAGALRRRALERRLAGVAVGETSDRAVERSDLASIVHEEVDRLPERYRGPIVLCDLGGQTCEEAAQTLSCPVGTVASRLARGRARLRDRLARRGLAPLGALALAESTRAIGGEVPLALLSATLRAIHLHPAAIGPSSAVAAQLSGDIARSLLMDKIRAIAAASAVAATLAAVGTLGVAGLQEPNPPPAPKAEAEPKFDKGERYKDYLMATVGNMRPLIEDAKGFRFQSREAILYKDGTVKLYDWDVKDPVVPTIRHDTPIREMNILDEAKVLITSSDDAVKVWDGLSGEPRKTITGHFARPLFFSRDAGADRFATVDLDGRAITLWDTKTLEPAATIRPDDPAKIIGAGLSKDGKALATIGEDRAITLRDAADGKPFATLRAPCPLILQVFGEKPGIGRPTLHLDDPFWEAVKPLLPRPAPAVKK